MSFFKYCILLKLILQCLKPKIMSSLKAASEIMSNPIKLQELKLNGLLIKGQKNKWKLILISFMLGLVSSSSSVLLSNITDKTEKNLDATILLKTINSQTEMIKTLSNEIITLKQTSIKTEDSSLIKNNYL